MWDKEQFPEGCEVTFNDDWGKRYIRGIVDSSHKLDLDRIFVPVRIIEFTQYAWIHYKRSCVKGVHGGFHPEDLIRTKGKRQAAKLKGPVRRETIEI